jgi:hypothetical protein
MNVAIALAQITKASAGATRRFRGDTQKARTSSEPATELNPGIERTLLEPTERIARILAR